MQLTFGQLLQVISPYLGRGGASKVSLTSEPTRLQAAGVLQEYVQRYGTLRKWSVYSRDNIIALPKDLAVVLKAKVNGKVETVHSQWYEFYETRSSAEFDSCQDQWQCDNGVIQEVNTFPTIKDIPCEGAYVLAEIGRRCKDIKDRYTIIQGISADTGQDVFTTHKGELIHGERLDLEQGVSKRTRTRFKKITSITKNETDDYVKYWFQVNKDDTPCVLSLLEPKELSGSFKRAKILDESCDCRSCYRVDILGRVEIKSDYHDNDIIPITSLSSIVTLAQAGQALKNNNIQAAGFKYQLLDKQIEDEQMHNRVQDTSLNVDIDLSPGSIDYLL